MFRFISTFLEDLQHNELLILRCSRSFFLPFFLSFVLCFLHSYWPKFLNSGYFSSSDYVWGSTNLSYFLKCLSRDTFVLFRNSTFVPLHTSFTFPFFHDALTNVQTLFSCYSELIRCEEWWFVETYLRASSSETRTKFRFLSLDFQSKLRLFLLFCVCVLFFFCCHVNNLWHDFCLTNPPVNTMASSSGQMSPQGRESGKHRRQITYSFLNFI